MLKIKITKTNEKKMVVWDLNPNEWGLLEDGRIVTPKYKSLRDKSVDPYTTFLVFSEKTGIVLISGHRDDFGQLKVKKLEEVEFDISYC